MLELASHEVSLGFWRWSRSYDFFFAPCFFYRNLENLEISRKSGSRKFGNPILEIFFGRKNIFRFCKKILFTKNVIFHKTYAQGLLHLE